MRAPEAIGLPDASVELLAAALQEVEPTTLEPNPQRRYERAQLIALRAGAAVLAAQARADHTATRPRSVWTMLCGITPELREWAEFFALSDQVMTRRHKLGGGNPTLATDREADDLLRDARRFVDVVVEYLTRRGQVSGASGRQHPRVTVSGA